MVSLLPHPASFRFHLTMDTLAFGCTLPTTGRVRVFHPLETCAAGRTKKTLAVPGKRLWLDPESPKINSAFPGDVFMQLIGGIDRALF